jgi:hypothetical protein
MLEIELEAVGIRLNTKPPDVVFRQKAAGGITVCPTSSGETMLMPQVTMTVKLTHTNERTIRSILQTYRSELSCANLRQSSSYSTQLRRHDQRGCEWPPHQADDLADGRSPKTSLSMSC